MGKRLRSDQFFFLKKSLIFFFSLTSCIACSQYVLDEYLKNRDEFLLSVINNPNYLQDVTKITETLNAMDLDNAIICLDEEDNFCSPEEEIKK